MAKKTEYKELLGLAGTLATPVTRTGLARIIKKARAERRLTLGTVTGYFVVGTDGEIREFEERI